MITKKRFSFFFGLISSLFLAIGFSRAADRFDPVGAGSHLSSNSKPAPDCATATWIATDGN
jgi:hypothetical protein